MEIATGPVRVLGPLYCTVVVMYEAGSASMIVPGTDPDGRMVEIRVGPVTAVFVPVYRTREVT